MPDPAHQVADVLTVLRGPLDVLGRDIQRFGGLARGKALHVAQQEDQPVLVVELVQGLVDTPLCIDSSVPGALENGLAAAEGRPLLNSVTGEEERLEAILPLVKKYNVPVVAISNDDTGISEDPDVRFAVAKKIVERAADHGIPAHDIVVDPLVMPIGAMATAGHQVFTLVRRLREELGVNTTCGASNISFGLPNRHGINNAFLPMAMGAGMTSAIMNPVQLATSRKKYDEHIAKLAELGNRSEAGPLYLQVGRWYGERMGNIQYATACYGKVLQMDPENIGALSAIADLYKSAGQWDVAAPAPAPRSASVPAKPSGTAAATIVASTPERCAPFAGWTRWKPPRWNASTVVSTSPTRRAAMALSPSARFRGRHHA